MRPGLAVAAPPRTVPQACIKEGKACRLALENAGGYEADVVKIDPMDTPGAGAPFVAELLPEHLPVSLPKNGEGHRGAELAPLDAIEPGHADSGHTPRMNRARRFTSGTAYFPLDITLPSGS